MPSTITGGWRSSPKSTTDRSPSWSEWRGTAFPTKEQPTSVSSWRTPGTGSASARLLLEEILHAGEQRGIYQFSADVLTDNRRALRLLARHTAVIRRTVAGGVTSVVFSRRGDSALEATRHGRS
ncbi:MAG: hypothetical protein DME05_07280 [Candidatus Rokuibacteriota bacterium]|nr:MAG: hypothetical protein DME05_07280 [Candidatus Rokubacteria bacterium]PYN78267.1 MAG: hypothetical protein DMD97_06825 [Candidatus Rokubacteria bacterium]